jgi:predicted membrane protein
MEKNNIKPGIRHWLFQIVPPLFMLSILLFTRNGSSLVFLAGFFVLPVLISFFSIIFKLILFKKKKYFLLRPILTIITFLLILGIAQWTYNFALEQATNEVKTIHETCNKKMTCPSNPEGWKVNSTSIRRDDFGFWFKYPAIYSYDPEKLNIRVYRGPDIGEVITGGVNLPFEVKSYVEH